MYYLLFIILLFLFLFYLHIYYLQKEAFIWVDSELKDVYEIERSRHHISNIKKQGEDRIKQDKRRAKKNSRMQDVSNHSISMK